MIPILATLQLGGGSWTLDSSDNAVTLNSRQLCIAAECGKPGDVQVDATGVWHFTSGVQLRWRNNVDAETSLDGKTWTRAKLSFKTPSETPPSGLQVLAESYAGPAPGRWAQATDDCDRSKPVWQFDPIIRGQPSLTAYPNGAGAWRLRTGTKVVMCDDAVGQYGGVP